MPTPPEHTQFKKGQSGNPNGRPKKMETVLKDYFFDEHNLKLSKSQVHDIITNILSKSRNELVELAKRDELPFWVSLIARKAQRDYEKGSIHILDVLFDRVYGKPKEEVSQTVNKVRIFKPIDLSVQEDDSPEEDS